MKSQIIPWVNTAIFSGLAAGVNTWDWVNHVDQSRTNTNIN